MTDLRDLLDDASRPPDGSAIDPLALVQSGRQRVRRRTATRTAIGGAALAAVLAAALVVGPDRIGVGADHDRAPAGPAVTDDGPPPTVDTTAPDVTPPDVVPPGTELALGQRALVPVEHIGSGHVRLTVTGVRRGDTADVTSLADLDPRLLARADRGGFWYVDVTIAYVDRTRGSIGGYYLDPDVDAVTSDDTKVNKWTLGNDFTPCTPRGLPRRPQPGDTVRDCVVFQARGSAEVVGMRWGQFDTAYDVDGGEPVTWR